MFSVRAYFNIKQKFYFTLMLLNGVKDCVIFNDDTCNN